MHKKILFGLLALVTAAMSLLTACTSDSTSTSSQISSVSTSAAAAAPSATAAKTTAQANWWDKFGTPQYGGDITWSTNNLTPNFDTLSFIGLNTSLWFQAPLFFPDWTLDRSIWSMKGDFTPDQYFTGNVAESWELTDQQTLTAHLRKGVTWQNKAPVNGREFTAYDVQAHFEREMNPDSGSMFAGMLSSWNSVTATDNYTVVFKFKTPCGATAFQSVQDLASVFEAPEAVKAEGGKLADWTKAVGAGPWMLTGFTAGTSMTYSKNPTYWGYDPRYPQNQVPYADTLTLLAIPDFTTRMAALRTAKIDYLDGLDWQQTKTLSSSNPDLQNSPGSIGTGAGVVFRLDKAPFTDINVRKALNMAINREAIAKGLYGGNAIASPTGWISQAYTGYAYDYADWSQTLKDEYTYNPTAAKKLLADAGYPNGFNTNVVTASTINQGAFQTPLNVLETFKSYFSEIGVEMEIKAMDSTVMETYLREGKHDQMASQGGGATFPPTRSIDQWYSKGSDAGKSMVNDSVYDELRTKFWAASTASEAAQICVEADKHIVEQHWGVWIMEADTYDFWQPYLKGYSNESTNSGIIWSRLWIDQSLKK